MNEFDFECGRAEDQMLREWVQYDIWLEKTATEMGLM